MDKPNNLTWFCAALALPLLYLFSIGPVVFAVEKSGRSPELLTRVYSPLIWLHENTLLKQPLETYVEFWGRLAH